MAPELKQEHEHGRKSKQGGDWLVNASAKELAIHGTQDDAVAVGGIWYRVPIILRPMMGGGAGESGDDPRAHRGIEQVPNNNLHFTADGGGQVLDLQRTVETFLSGIDRSAFEVVLIGLPIRPDFPLIRSVQRASMPVECCQIDSLARTYNVLLAEDRHMMALFIPSQRIQVA
ncbi:MAG: hypothetical protein K0U36_00125 [Alphaproteobacteria bacterium]|nr:hypothetical protein [Alphaproteobacteria bacterium]